MDSFSTRSRFEGKPNPLTRALAERHAAGAPVLDLTCGNPTELGLSPSFAELLAPLTAPGLALYQPESFGLLSARSAIVAELAAGGFTVDASQVLLTASTSEAYGYLFKLLCDPGDSVLVPAPSYPLFDVLAQLEQVRLTPYHLAYDGEWHLDAASLAAARDARCKAVVVVHPNNPTGSFLKRGELAALAALGLPIISDEVFVDYALAPDDTRASSALEAADRVLVFRLSGLSKACALPQLKLAWTVMAGPEPHLAEARSRLEHIADAYLSPGTPVQHALPALLATGPATQARIRARVRHNLGTLQHALTSSAASVLRVEGGWYAVVRLPRLRDDEAWALGLLEQDGVLTQPGYYYGLEGGAYLVLSLLGEPAQMLEAADRLARRVATLAG
jgi:alanine-synthesizing transaminase